MTVSEFSSQVDTISNEELIKQLENCGHDGYYNAIYYSILKELCKRLNVDFSIINN